MLLRVSKRIQSSQLFLLAKMTLVVSTTSNDRSIILALHKLYKKSPHLLLHRGADNASPRERNTRTGLATRVPQLPALVFSAREESATAPFREAVKPPEDTPRSSVYPARHARATLRCANDRRRAGGIPSTPARELSARMPPFKRRFLKCVLVVQASEKHQIAWQREDITREGLAAKARQRKQIVRHRLPEKCVRRFGAVPLGTMYGPATHCLTRARSSRPLRRSFRTDDQSLSCSATCCCRTWDTGAESLFPRPEKAMARPKPPLWSVFCYGPIGSEARSFPRQVGTSAPGSPTLNWSYMSALSDTCEVARWSSTWRVATHRTPSDAEPNMLCVLFCVGNFDANAETVGPPKLFAKTEVHNVSVRPISDVTLCVVGRRSSSRKTAAAGPEDEAKIPALRCREAPFSPRDPVHRRRLATGGALGLSHRPSIFLYLRHRDRLHAPPRKGWRQLCTCFALATFGAPAPSAYFSVY